MSFVDEDLPALRDSVTPPLIRGTADLTTFAYQGNDHDSVMVRIDQTCDSDAGRLHDTAIAYQLAFRRAEGLDLQDAALEASQMVRVLGNPTVNRPLRLLALAGPGDLMVNTPLDFLTNHANIRLDLLYLLPDRPLPAAIPDHDVAFFAIGEADPDTLSRLCRLFDAWPRPALNNPKFLPVMTRDALSRALANVPGLCSPTAVAIDRPALEAHLRTLSPIDGFDEMTGPYPCLIRPASSHAGAGLARIDSPAALYDYLRLSFEQHFYLTAFHDYRGNDGFYRKSRVAFIDRQPFLCHMAISRNWMVHYLNAGMTESVQKRQQEAEAMARFDDDFARRHQAAFAALHERLGFDFYSIDCAETHEGQLLVFEADSAAIIHLMDPPDLFPYKQPQMRKVFAAFEAMVRKRATAGLVHQMVA
jgi:hypothetical protein